jgi:hypothetical protein
MLIAAIICPTLKNPQYGSVVVTNDYRVGSRATYTCYKGYKLVGVAVRICQHGGYYSDDAPICKRELGYFQIDMFRIFICSYHLPYLEEPSVWVCGGHQRLQSGKQGNLHMLQGI